jgi:hypothetical protein
MKEIFRKKNSPAISSPSFSCFTIWCLLVITRDLWWTNQEWLEIRLGVTIYQKWSLCKGRLLRLPRKDKGWDENCNYSFLVCLTFNRNNLTLCNVISVVRLVLKQCICFCTGVNEVLQQKKCFLKLEYTFPVFYFKEHHIGHSICALHLLQLVNYEHPTWTTIPCVNPLKPKLVWIIFKDSIRTSKKTQNFTIRIISWLILFKEMIPV